MKTTHIRNFAVLFVTAFLLSSCQLFPQNPPVTPDTSDTNSTNTTDTNNSTNSETTALAGLPKFDSCDALKDSLKEAGRNEEKRTGFFSKMMNADSAMESAPSAMMAEGGGGGGAATDFSATNVQVEGVDEADTVKNDGKYIYAVSGNRVTISNAYPPKDATLMSVINYDSSDTYQGGYNTVSNYVSNIFVYKDSLLIFGSRYYSFPPRLVDRMKSAINPYGYPYPTYNSKDVTFIDIYDLADREKPELKRSVEIEGYSSQARMIDDDVYFVLTKYIDYTYGTLVPMYRDSLTQGLEFKMEDTFEEFAGCENINYIEPIYPYNYLIVGSLDIDNYEGELQKEVIVGSSESLYASQKNLYVVQTDYSYWYGPRVESGEDIGKDWNQEKTTIHKFSLNDGTVKFEGKGQVTGHVLNQFSMDENGEYFRIATTTGYSWMGEGDSGSKSNVYVLDKDLKQVGAVEDLAPGEQIYSARFVGNKGYLVTFKQIDPLFVLDLSNPTEPKVLGKLKIPGYSNYLHPYDENHIIGFGKDTEEATEEEGGFAWYQGVKIAMFDVTDVENPKELYKIILGDRGSDSPILWDHKALLFDKEKHLMVLPITIAQISDTLKADPTADRWTYGNTTWQGAIVYDVTLDGGFKEVARISHVEDDTAYTGSGDFEYYYFDGYATQINRSLYMENYLYTVSMEKILINDLDKKLEEVNSIDLKYTNPYPMY